MRSRIILPVVGLLMIIIGISLLLTETIPQSTTQSIDLINYSSPSYLLLSNWNNLSIYVSTGYPIPNPELNGEYSLPPSIVNIYYGDYGSLNMNITLVGTGSTQSAYLTLNNSIVINEEQGRTIIILPPNHTSIAIIQSSKTPINISVFIQGYPVYSTTNNTVTIITKPLIKLRSTGNFTVSKIGGLTVIRTTIINGSLIITLGNKTIPTLNEIIMTNYQEVRNLLSLVKKPRLSGLLLQEYYLSVLLLLDNQNPVTGEFAASPEPVYLYSWVRDGSFSAMALQEAGLYEQAMKYWLWMCNTQNSTGTWYTRYDFWSGLPDVTFGIPEYDSIGLFQIGVWEFYEYTGNKTFLMTVLPCIERSFDWEITEIKESGGLIPRDLSVWEVNYAYNFWTQSIDDLGVYDVAKIYNALGLNDDEALIIANELHGNITHNFYSRGFFSQALTEITLFTGSGSTVEYVPNGVPDSSVILPIALGFIDPGSNMAKSTVDFIMGKLMVKGGLARFPGDDYHYTESLYDSSGPDPPWIISTLFLALYYEDVGNYTGAYQELLWCVKHSQYGLLPEALDPSTLKPLPTTSPLTWSAAMYVITALNYRGTYLNELRSAALIIISVVLFIFAMLLIMVYRRGAVKRA